jgi:hypothetical protein
MSGLAATLPVEVALAGGVVLALLLALQVRGARAHARLAAGVAQLRREQWDAALEVRRLLKDVSERDAEVQRLLPALQAMGRRLEQALPRLEEAERRGEASEEGLREGEARLASVEEGLREAAERVAALESGALSRAALEAADARRPRATFAPPPPEEEDTGAPEGASAVFPGLARSRRGTGLALALVGGLAALAVLYLVLHSAS